MREGWRRVRLGDLFRVTAERLGSHESEPPIFALSKYEGIIAASEYFDRRIASANLDAYKVMRPGAWAYSTIHIDEGSIARNNTSSVGVLSPMYTTLKWQAAEHDPRYLEHLLRTPALLAEYRNRAQGTVNRRRSLGFPAFAAIEVDLPPIAEQRRIVDLMSAVDTVANASRMIAEAGRRLAASMREQAFADRAVFPVPLAEVAVEGGIQIGPFGSQLHASDYVPAGVPVVMPQDIVDGGISTDRIAYVAEADASRLGRHRLREGDILLSRRGDLTKRALVDATQSGWLCGTGTVRVRLAGVDPRAGFEALRTSEVNRWLQDNAVGATLPNLNTAIVGRVPLRIPENAGAVASAIAASDEMAHVAHRQLATLSTARSALLASLLAGESRLPASYDRFLDVVA